MKYSFYQINPIKKVFRNTCQIDIIIWISKSSHFNFLKQYVISHCPEQIKHYESATSFTIGIEETIYITQIKDFFKCTNIRKGYKKQILDYNIEKFSLIIRDNINLFFSIKVLTKVNKNAIL